MTLSSKFIEIRNSNETKILAILEAMKMYASLFQVSLLVERDSSNAILWASGAIGVR